jgi:sensor domain CHASE-containing protein
MTERNGRLNALMFWILGALLTALMAVSMVAHNAIMHSQEMIERSQANTEQRIERIENLLLKRP